MKYFIKTYGCQMNVYDSERMQDMLRLNGYEQSDSVQNADVVILNTCHIREKAAEKVFSDLGRMKPFKAKKQKSGGNMVIAVAGCVAQAEGEEIIRRAPFVDLVFGPQNFHELIEMVQRSEKERTVNIDINPVSKFDTLPDVGARGSSAFVAVQEGCNNYCAYCVVPYTRGREYSRPVEAVLHEVQTLIDNGVSEIHLLGQNVNAYHGKNAAGKEVSLAELIRQIAEFEQVKRIRYTTSHPKDMDQELINTHAEIGKLMPFIHLPIQAGSDNMLKAMGRKHTVAEYRAIIDKLRTARADIAISSDFIVGFPGEKDEDFAETLKIVEEVGYSQAYSFKYSIRPNTRAETMTEQIPADVKVNRLAALQDLINAKQIAFNEGFKGMIMPVLMENLGGREKGQVSGRSPYMQTVYAQGDDALIGKIVNVKITKANPNSLTGEIV